MPTDTQVNDLKINVLSEAQYEQIQSPSSTELYLVPDTVDTVPTQGSTNTITSGAVYSALQNMPQEVLVCTFTGTSTVTCDKTYSEIYTAWQDKKPIIGIRSAGYYVASYVSSTWAFFCYINSPASNEPKIHTIYTLDSGTTWNFHETPIQLKLIGSGTGQNIKTINNESLLGSGNISISSGDVNVQSDWNQTDNTADDYIKNKPTLGTAAAKNVPSSGNASTTEVVMGNDSRLTDARTPTAHTHGNITNDGKVGSASGKILTTGTGGAVQASDSITKSMISDFPSLATVATSGSYNDLSNKPTIPTVPTNVSDFTNDAGYITASDVPVEVIWFTFSLSSTTYVSSITPAQILAYLQAGKCVLGLHPNDKETDTKDVYHCMRYVYNEKSGDYVLSFANAKTKNLVYFVYDSTVGYWKLYEYPLQGLLVGSGTGQNIKTINNTSLLGSGNITIHEGDDNVQSDWNQSDSTADDFIKNKPTITDDKVKQTVDATTTEYPLLVSAQSSPTSGTAYESKYSASLKATGEGDVVFVKNSTKCKLHYNSTDLCFNFVFE